MLGRVWPGGATGGFAQAHAGIRVSPISGLAANSQLNRKSAGAALPIPERDGLPWAGAADTGCLARYMKGIREVHRRYIGIVAQLNVHHGLVIVERNLFWEHRRFADIREAR
jgi:hypothetical protein